MSSLPREARDGLMRAWLKVLTDRHPEYTWTPVTGDDEAGEAVRLQASSGQLVLAA
jgi:hypothetical protein